MALMVMFDGLRADGIESGSMPNVMSLRNGTWQAGYNGAWSVTAQIAPGSDSVSAPNHISIATGYSPARHGATANGQTANVDYTTYPTWLKRVIDAKSGATAAFAYSWGEDAGLGPAAGVTFLGGTDAQNATDLAALLASSSAPDATMFFINEPDVGGHAGNFRHREPSDVRGRRLAHPRHVRPRRLSENPRGGRLGDARQHRADRHRRNFRHRRADSGTLLQLRRVRLRARALRHHGLGDGGDGARRCR